MFKLNDHVIYPGHGVARVADVIEKTVSGKTINFLMLSFIFKDTTILVPMYNVATIGIRYPSSEQEVDLALYELSKQPEKKLESIDFTPSGWNRRFKHYQQKLQSGKLFDIAQIYRDLMYIAQQKDLSFGERGILQTTEDLISQEIQIVKNKDREVIVQLLRNPFKLLTFHDRSFLQQEAL